MKILTSFSIIATLVIAGSNKHDRLFGTSEWEDTLVQEHFKKLAEETPTPTGADGTNLTAAAEKLLPDQPALVNALLEAVSKNSSPDEARVDGLVQMCQDASIGGQRFRHVFPAMYSQLAQAFQCISFAISLVHKGPN